MNPWQEIAAWTTIAVALSTGSAVTAAAPSDPAPESHIDYVGGYLTWHDLHLDMTAREAAEAIGPTFKVKPPAVAPGCPLAEVAYRGGHVYLCFSGYGPEDRLTSVFIPFSWYRSLRNIVPVLTDRVPELVYWPSTHKPEVGEAEDTKPLYVLANDPDQGVLIGPEEGLWIVFVRTLD